MWRSDEGRGFRVQGCRFGRNLSVVLQALSSKTPSPEEIRQVRAFLNQMDGGYQQIADRNVRTPLQSGDVSGGLDTGAFGFETIFSTS